MVQKPHTDSAIVVITRRESRIVIFTDINEPHLLAVENGR